MAHLHGYELEGEPCPELLAPGPGPLGRIRIEPASEEQLLGPAAELTMLRPDAGGVAAFAIARRDGRFVVWGRGRGCSEADPEALSVRICPGPSAEPWAHQLATVVVPLLLAERGLAALHASGVVAGGRAVIFAGGSGRGKSTTAMLATAAGLAPLSDDAVVFSGEAPVAYAGGSGLWTTPRAAAAATPAGAGDELADERAARRIHLPADEPPSGPSPVAAIVALGARGSVLSSSRLDPAAALQRLVPALLHVGDRAALQRCFSGLAGVVERVPVWEARMPGTLAAAREAAPRLVDAVLRDEPG